MHLMYSDAALLCLCDGDCSMGNAFVLVIAIRSRRRGFHVSLARGPHRPSQRPPAAQPTQPRLRRLRPRQPGAGARHRGEAAASSKEDCMPAKPRVSLQGAPQRDSADSVRLGVNMLRRGLQVLVVRHCPRAGVCETGSVGAPVRGRRRPRPECRTRDSAAGVPAQRLRRV